MFSYQTYVQTNVCVKKENSTELEIPVKKKTALTSNVRVSWLEHGIYVMQCFSNFAKYTLRLS